jgi:uncharacterized BrkB/YihY/UPF0761 family membrane protein
MNVSRALKANLLTLLLIALSPSAMACATCFGQSDEPLAKGMNMGILTLLCFVVLMWAGIAAFFVFLAKKAAVASGSLTSGGATQSNSKTDQ